MIAFGRKRPRFGPVLPPSRHRPEVPSWLDDAVLTALHADRDARFSDIIELLRALEGGGTLALGKRRKLPILRRLCER